MHLVQPLLPATTNNGRRFSEALSPTFGAS